jgi:hypothetical protein
MSTQAVSGLQRPGWLTFAAVVMFGVGVMRVISAIYYFADSNRVNALGTGAFSSHLFWWGIWDLCIAALAIYAGYSLLNGNLGGRVIGYFWAILVLIQSFLIMGQAPVYALCALGVALLVIYGISKSADWSEGQGAAY